MPSLSQQRQHLIEYQLKARGIIDPAVLDAFARVRREAYLQPEMAEFAYRDTALPIERGQTISQPYIVALMAQALELKPQDRVLEVGTGSGYAAAILGTMGREVYTIERHAELAAQATKRLQSEGFKSVHVLHGDGTLGWPEHAPFDAIVVAAGGPEVPRPLMDQLTLGGRLVIPVGEEKSLQKLVRVTRVSQDEFRREELCDVRFVPLIGARGWRDGEPAALETLLPSKQVSRPTSVAELIRELAEPLAEIEGADTGPLIERIGDSRLILIGEATHGTSEFYRIRCEITKELIQRGIIQFVALEADWPDAARVDQYVRDLPRPKRHSWDAFARFPTWMWRNQEVQRFVEWLRQYNQGIDDPSRRVAFYGLDLYSLFTSVRAVLDYLDRVDSQAAQAARLRYGCLSPWEGDPALYGRLATSGRYRSCEHDAVAILTDLLQERLDYVAADGSRYFDAVQNARLVANAERYYRVMYRGSNESWNLRDQHMFDTLELLLGFHGAQSRAAVWEHNSHLGDARSTAMGGDGQLNVGQLCRQRFGDAAYLIGQGTDHGTVAAANNWDEPVEIMEVRPAHPESHERLCHDARVEAFFLPLREPRRPELREEMNASRLERAIGVIYRPQTELASHYFHARLAPQFDEFIWFDRTTAVHPIDTSAARQLAPDHPFFMQ